MPLYQRPAKRELTPKDDPNSDAARPEARRINSMLQGEVQGDAQTELRKIRMSMNGGFKLALDAMT